jgi:hypothetical protein
MADIKVRPSHLKPIVVDDKKSRLTAEWMQAWWFRLLALLFVTEILVPFVIWKAGLPSRMDFPKEIAAGILVAFTFGYMLLRDRIPGAILVIFGITTVWGALALLEGQSGSATLWGWWRLFKYPMIGVFAYLIPDWPADFARWFFRFCVGLMVFEVAVQMVQYVTGTPPGDTLAGTFAWNGVGSFTLFTFLMACLGLGHWLATQQWKVLLLIIVLGTVGSMLSLTKFYLMATALLIVTAVLFHLVRGGQFKQLFTLAFLFVMGLAILLPVYNTFIARTRGLPPLQEYLRPEAVETYLFNDGKGDEDGTYNLGRGLAVTYGWQQVSGDPVTMLFGFGLGSRTTSTALGLAGRGLEDDLYGGSSAPSLGTWLQEFGLAGLVLFLLINLWLIWNMVRHARSTTDPYLATFAYGLSLYTLYWPLWHWYQKPWVSGSMMIIYWVALGFVFSQINGRKHRKSRLATGRQTGARANGVTRRPLPPQ